MPPFLRSCEIACPRHSRPYAEASARSAGGSEDARPARAPAGGLAHAGVNDRSARNGGFAKNSTTRLHGSSWRTQWRKRLRQAAKLATADIPYGDKRARQRSRAFGSGIEARLVGTARRQPTTANALARYAACGLGAS